jgi:hypothetical protein
MPLYRVQCSCGVEEIPASHNDLLQPARPGGFPLVTCDCGAQVPIVVVAPTQGNPRQYTDFDKRHGEQYKALEPGTTEHKRWRTERAEQQRERVRAGGFRDFDHMKRDSRALAKAKAAYDRQRGVR